MRNIGGLVIAGGAGLGLAVSIWNFLVSPSLFEPTSDVAQTPAALVAVAVTLALLLAGLVLAGRRRGAALTAFLVVGCLAGIAGGALTAWLVESRILLALMLVCAIGWLIRVARPARSA